jgi:hypothetical protein
MPVTRRFTQVKALCKYITPSGFRAKVATAGAMAVMGAALFAGSAQACSYTGAVQTFKPWGDVHSYVLAPEGGFETGTAGWTLEGGAATVAGNESYVVNSTTDSHSLALPAGSAVVSPPLCMSLETPVIRMFARNTGDPSSKLKVEETYSLGVVHTAAVYTVTAGKTWAPTQELSTMATLAPLLGTIVPGAIRVRVSPLDSKGQWQIDDFYVDPFARH